MLNVVERIIYMYVISLVFFLIMQSYDITYWLTYNIIMILQDLNWCRDYQ